MDINKIKLYPIIDLEYCSPKDSVDVAEKIIKAGVKVLQLRGKKSSDKELFEVSKNLNNIAKLNSVSLIINNRADICLLSESDGVHLGQDDISIENARKLLGKDSIIGISTHSIEQAKKAFSLDVNYISVGPIFKTSTKPHLAPIGIDILDEIVSISTKPIIAIGGITLDNVDMFFGKGIIGVASVSAILKSSDIEKYTRKFLHKLEYL